MTGLQPFAKGKSARYTLGDNDSMIACWEMTMENMCLFCVCAQSMWVFPTAMGLSGDGHTLQPGCIQGKRTGLRRLQHRKTQGHGICHHVRPKLIKALAADQLETHRQNHQLSQARSNSHGQWSLLPIAGNQSWGANS